MRVGELDYRLPDEAVAQAAIEPRDASRLLVTETMEDRLFSDLPELLAPGDLVVVNRTRVRAARLTGRRAPSGGRVEALLLRRVDTDRWEALLRPARRLHAGDLIELDGVTGRLLSDPVGGVATMGLTSESGDVDDLLPTIGSVPLPPYFRGELSDPERYQTMFAKTVGSAAAPTAGLHFTPSLVDRLAARGIAIAEVELEVGLDTFRPMTAERTEDHHIHRERYLVPDDAAERIAATHAAAGRIVAVGTTVVRTLETAAQAPGVVVPGAGESDLFIAPGHVFRVVDAIVTNFHAPRTTLIALVAAALGSRWRTVYDAALGRGYRFLSFGDAMLIDPMKQRPGRSADAPR